MDESDDHGSTPGSGRKRRNQDQDQAPRRAKRNRYISIACNECKRRKIKCNGLSPCQRCGNLKLECVYAPNCCSNFKDSEEFQQMSLHIGELQQQVQTLFSSLNSLISQPDSLPGTLDERSSNIIHSSASISTPSAFQGAKYPRFHGPTSAVFNLGVAKSSLNKNFGITTGIENGEDPRLMNDPSPMGTPPPIHTMPPRMVEPRDVLWTISKEEALRLVDVWRENLHVMYPIVDMTKIVRYVEQLYSFIDAGPRTGLITGNLPAPEMLSDDETNTLRLVLATAVELEASGPSDFGLELFRSVTTVIESLTMRPPDMKGLEHLVLASLFYFHRDDEALAWRLNGMAGRMCFELGIHQVDAYQYTLKSNAERYRATILLWTIYVLDRRWSFGTGLPFVMQDMDIGPVLKPASPYLSSMVELTMMSSKIWPRIANSNKDSKLNIGEFEYLDQQIVRWQQELPDGLNYASRDQDSIDHVNNRLRVLLYLRANQTRILIGRQVLLSTNAIMENLSYANCVVDVAKDTIQVLSHLNQTTERYQNQQGLYNYFLVSALAALFLAVAHAPSQYGNNCRDEFYMALDLIRGFSSNSFVAKRLWKTIRVLKEIGPKIGLVVRNPTTDANDAHSSAAVAMAGLSGIPMDSLTVYPPPSSAMNDNYWRLMADDLSGLFEAAGNMPAYPPITERSPGIREMPPSLFDNQDGLSQAFKYLY